MQVIPWYERDTFWATFRPILFPEARMRAAADEVDGFLALTGLASGARVLDLGCGPGRHSLELARRGMAVTGLDRTASYLAELSEAARREDLPVEVVQADMREIRGTWDAALCAFTTFGYFDDPADDRRVLDAVLGALTPGGALIIDVLGKEVVARGHQQRYWTWLEPGVLLLEERTVEGDFEAMVNRWTIVADGRRREHVMRHRLYAATELRALLTQAGFTGVRVVGGWRGEPYDHRADRLIVVARAP